MRLLSKLHPAITVTALQLCVGLVGLALGLSFGASPEFGYSVWCGSGVATVSQAVFGWWVFRARGARNAKRIANNLFIGEGLKLVLTASLFAVLLSRVAWLEPGGALGGFIATVVAGQFALFSVGTGRK